MQNISFEESLSLVKPVYIDVRAPIEYEEDHITGAINIPIFDNAQRAEIGTLYKMAGRDQAVLRGTEIAGQKLSDLIKQFQALKDRELVIYCARGGMRSKSVAELLNSLGMPVSRLIDGYKGYRRYVNMFFEKLDINCPIYILQGLTGTGKTEIIHKLENAIDLEGMAGHRSSIFGGIGLEQKSQKCFETQLFARLHELTDAKYIVLEGESRKIGNLHIPEKLYAQMRAANIFLIEADVERRVDIILNDYASYTSLEIITPKVMSISQKIGKAASNLLVELYSEGNMREFVRILFEKYYDPLYVHSLNKLQFIARIENIDSEKAATDINERIKKHSTTIT